MKWVKRVMRQHLVDAGVRSYESTVEPNRRELEEKDSHTANDEFRQMVAKSLSVLALPTVKTEAD